MNKFEAPSLRELIDAGAEKYGDSTFLKYIFNSKVEERSFSELQRHSKALCRWIRNISTDRMHIAILSKTEYEYIVSFSATLISGNVAVPFAPEISVKEAVDLFERADIDMLFYENDFSANAKEIREKCPRIKTFFNMGDLEKFDEIYEKFSDESEFAPLSDIEVDKDECAVIIYTSGTTGVKKGVMLSSNALIGNIMYHDYCTDIFNENDVSMSVLPMYHCYCLSGDFIKNLKDGLQVCLNRSLREMMSNLLIFQPKVVRVVPKIAQSLLQRIKMMCMRNPSLDPKDAAKKVFGNNIKWLISGGAYLNPELAAEYDKLGIYLRQGYGMTEAGCRISVPDSEVAIESVGRVTDVCTVRVHDGEIQVSAPTLMMGYYKMPEETAKVFTEDGWLRTGDIGYVTDDNQLFITGRVKNLIILSGGENVSPEAIEKKFAANELIVEVLVYAENDKIVAEIFPDYAYAKSQGIEDIKAAVEAVVDEMNTTAKASHIISVVKIRKTPLERTESGKIKRRETKI